MAREVARHRATGVVFDQPNPETPAKPRPRPAAVTPPPFLKGGRATQRFPHTSKQIRSTPAGVNEY